MDAKSLTDLLCALDGDSAVHLILEALRTRPALSPAVVSFACPALTYAPARGMMERRCRGVVKHVDRTQGFGYIASPEIEATFGMDVVVRDIQLGAFQTGEEVSFTCVLNEENKPQAYEVLTVAGTPHPGVAPTPEWADWNEWTDGNDPKKRRLQVA
ncbi:Spag6 [Symbiodinium pilosum]|uniref:Spag6 protein n=1 Tax=Symbiodinium pilosum TaxID=2952 RepID=A0A812XYT0_SYMPI|nr:Spag6 [Symbiodinium pilosum]